MHCQKNEQIIKKIKHFHKKGQRKEPGKIIPSPSDENFLPVT
jgi:hypothetical protein